jgi:hypothetical protein
VADAWAAGKAGELAKAMRVGELANVLFESAQWREIYRSLAPRADAAVTEKLRTFVKGPNASSAENVKTSSNDARNVAFELSIAGRLMSSGFEVDFTPRPDLVAFHRGYSVFIECKRLQSGNQLRKRIREAHRALDRRCREGIASRGLVALSVSKVLNPKSGLLDVHDAGELDRQLQAMMDRFVVANGAKWSSPPSAFILGAIVEFRCCARIQAPPQLAPGGFIAVHYVGPSDSFDHRFALGFAEQFAQENLVDRALQLTPPSPFTIPA